VVVKTSSAAPVAAAYLWLDVGSSDETLEEAGTAHFLEHLVFKGTARRGVGEAAAEIEGLGGDLNAYTTFDHTVLHATIGSEHWRQALDVIADMARNSRFDSQELLREREVVVDEIRGYDDDPESVVHDALQSRLFPEHAYGRPILGTEASVRTLSRETILDFWSRGYAPHRAVLAVAGPVEAAEVLETAQTLFGSWSAGASRPAPPEAPLPRRQGPHRVRREFDAATAQIAWRTPPIGHPDLPALEVLCAALGQGAAGLLPVKLQLEEGVTTAVWSDLSSRIGGGALSIGLYPLETRTPDAIAIALEVISGTVRRGLSGMLVERARLAMLADQLFAQETVDGLAHDLAWYTARKGSPQAQARHLEAIRAVSPADVHRVARTWLKPDRAHIVAVDSSLSTEALRRACKTAPTPAPRPRKGVVSETINGARISVLPDDTAVASIRIVGLGGALAVQPRTAGMAEAWSQMVVAGAGDWNATAYAEAQDRIAAVVHGVSGRNTTGLHASFPAANLQDCVDLVGQAMVDPHFDEEEWHRVQAEILEDLRTLEDRPGQVSGRAMWAALFPKHPWRLPHSGTVSTIKRIRTATLARWHQQIFSADNLAIAVAGGVDPDAVFETLSPWLMELGRGSSLPDRPRPGAPRRTLAPLHAGNEQASVTFCVRGPDLYSPDRPALEVAAAVLGAQGGRLFLDLREGRGLGYSVWSQWLGGLDGSIFLAGLATDPTRRAEATEALRETLDHFAAEGPTPAEVERCRRMLLGQMAMSLQRVSGRATDLAIAERYGLPWGLQAWRKQLESVDAKAVVEALQRMALQDPLEIAVVPR
jgi:zinc protease